MKDAAFNLSAAHCRRVQSLLLVGLLLLPAGVRAQRDPYLQPFSKTSIWNMSLHNDAVYVAANLNGNPTNPDNVANAKWATMPLIDEEHIVLTPTAPLCTLKYCSVAWGAGDRCVATNSTVKAIVPMPNNYLVPDGNANSCATFLAADGRTLLQSQPLARCIEGRYGTVLVTFPNVDLYGSGESGNHGGSLLSGIGGSIRLGELRPGQTGPRHALKLVVYAKQFLYPGTTRANCYRWPATTSDSYAVGWYGSNSNATNTNNTNMKMGALVAIPPTTDITQLGLETEPGRQLAWTLQNYGAYIVDDTYAEGYGFCAEDGNAGSVETQFQADYGQALRVRVTENTSWMRDNQRLCVALRCVSNNGPTMIGGGPTADTVNRRQPMICDFGTPGSGATCHSVQLPVAPTLVSPAAGATSQPLSLTLTWSTVSGATTYRVQVSTGSTFSSTMINDSTLTVAFKAVGPLSAATTYYWRVNAKNTAGTSGWSAVRSFVTTPSTSVEADDEGDQGSLGLTVYPTPFNPVVKIRIKGAKNLMTGPSALKLVVYDLNGKNVADLTSKLRGSEIVWNPNAAFSGVYVVKVTAGTQSVSKKITLIK